MGRAGLFETTGITYSGATTTLAYDFEGRVTSITRSGKTTNSFTYNGLNARMTRSDSNGSRTMLRDGADVLAPVLKDGSKEYAPSLYQWTSGGGSKPFVTDRLGTVGTITDWTGNSPASKTFDAFGVQQSGGTSDLFAFAGAWGYQSDADHGLQQVGHRVYDPDLGRFLTRDPVKDGRNWYRYCQNNPLKSVDPKGLFQLKVGLGGHLQLFFVGVHLSVDISMDHRDRIAISITRGIGAGGGFGGSAGINVGADGGDAVSGKSLTDMLLFFIGVMGVGGSGSLGMPNSGFGPGWGFGIGTRFGVNWGAGVLAAPASETDSWQIGGPVEPPFDSRGGGSSW